MQFYTHNLTETFTARTWQRPTSQNDAASTFKIEANDNAEIDAIKSRYDPENISPREIDQMHDELVQAGYPNTKELHYLSMRGERYQSRIWKVVVDPYSGDPIQQRPDPKTKINVLAAIDFQMQLSSHAGKDTTSYQSLMDFLSSFKPNSYIPRQSLFDGVVVGAVLNGQRVQLQT